MMPARPTADLDTIRAAIERRDAGLLESLYAEDAVLRFLGRDRPPARPLELRGRREIGPHLRRSLARESAVRLENPVVGGHGIAFLECRRYPDGSQAVAATVVGLDDGLICWQTTVLASDD